MNSLFFPIYWPVLLHLPLVWWGGGHQVLSSALFSFYTLPQRPYYSFALNCHLYANGTQIRSFSPDFIPGLQNDLPIAFWASPLVFLKII